ncbi:TVP38/TMEM64 family protein [Deinococcus puniceus]|uniref:TVP38/TMEM64 family membrane protein n=1 Tax=Deinococcus puniceus TaxID=1182568 RepID=A0A172T8R3_9DEIO|nr:VTT domain-containing protein [Deinococcus puniceus]ANE43381.1 membrane protein [Deinococcus puniceus]
MSSATSARAPAYLRYLLLGGVLALLGSLFLIPEVRAFFAAGSAALRSSNPAVTHAWVNGLGWAGPLALIAAFVAQAVIPVLPALVMTAVTARAYGPVEGFFIVYIGTLLGAAAGYWLGRGVGDQLVRMLAGERTRKRAEDFALKHGVQGVLMVRLMPILSADVMNLVAGAARMPFRPFLLATAAGAFPVTLLVIWLSGSTSRMVWGLGVLSLLVAGVAGGRTWLGRRRAARAGSASPAPESQQD